MSLGLATCYAYDAGAHDKGFAMMMASTLQGRFKQELALEDVLTGQSFDRPARNLPPHWLVENVLVKVAPQFL